MIKDCQSHGCKICGKWHHMLIQESVVSNGGQGLSQQQENLQATYISKWINGKE